MVLTRQTFHFFPLELRCKGTVKMFQYFFTWMKKDLRLPPCIELKVVEKGVFRLYRI